MLSVRSVSPTEKHSEKRPSWEVADIFCEYGKDFRNHRLLPLPHLKVMHAIEVCRTSSLGGHIERCDACGYEKPAYNSCRNRHCPKCQAVTKSAWREARRNELLPVGYFHTVFTLPHELNPIVLCNQKVIFDLLFSAVSETLIAFGKNPKNGLGGKIGFIAVLHTWDQTLLDHIHLHCLIPGGALSWDQERWIPARENYLFPVQALSRTFRGKFLDFLKRAFESGRLIFPGKTAVRGSEDGFSRVILDTKKKDWVVYSKRPFAGPEQVLSYLGRYTQRVAISNHRIVDVGKGNVTFTYKDRRDADRLKQMTLKAQEFIRRFLLHVLPQGLVRIRHFGFLANRCKKKDLLTCRRLLGRDQAPTQPTPKTTAEWMLEWTGVDITKCPCCKEGTLRVIREIPPRMDSS